MFEAHIITLYPEVFPGPLGISIIDKARQEGRWTFYTYQLRDYATDRHKTVDDIPFGGGAGMIIKPEVLAAALDDILAKHTIDKIIYFSPRGILLKQAEIRKLISYKRVIFICGRFEGVDERLIEEYNVAEYSIGDYIMTGGEIACLATLDACLRLIPGVVGNPDTLLEESFGESLEYSQMLEYPQYTRPAVWRNRAVPTVLISGNHAKIREWRLKHALLETYNRRPDLINSNKKEVDNE